jgi:hypothetical protein
VSGVRVTAVPASHGTRSRPGPGVPGGAPGSHLAPALEAGGVGGGGPAGPLDPRQAALREDQEAAAAARGGGALGRFRGLTDGRMDGRTKEGDVYVYYMYI